VYEETLTGRPHDTSVQKATSDNKLWMQFDVLQWTSLGVDAVHVVKGRGIMDKAEKSVRLRCRDRGETFRKPLLAST